MPIYEYKCSQCGVEFEKLVLRIGGTIDVTCEHCGSRNVTQMVSTFASPSDKSAGAGPSCAPAGG